MQGAQRCSQNTTGDGGGSQNEWCWHKHPRRGTAPPPPAVAAYHAAQRRWSRGNIPLEQSHGQRTCPACRTQVDLKRSSRLPALLLVGGGLGRAKPSPIPLYSPTRG
eukprot:5734329-Prymnesium_polylepis.1